MTVVINGDTGITQAGEFNSDSTMGFKNRIINGAMRIAQRGTAAVSTDGTFPVDRWRQSMSGGGVLTSNQSTTAPTGFINSTLVTISTADATIAAADFYNFNQQIEGFNIADLGFGTANAQSVTLSFWVRSSATGTFAGCLSNSAANRSYTFTYDILVADTFEYKTVEIEGDTSGTWLSNNGIGIRVVFDLGGGSDSQGTADTWQSGFKSATASSVKLISTLNATWYVTGVQLEVGTVATSFDFRSYGTELALCQRYYEIGRLYGSSYFQNSSANALDRFEATYCFKQTKRASPTVASVNLGTGTIATQVADIDAAAFRRTGTFDSPLNITLTASAEF